MMGRGKSSAAINYINSSRGQRFLVITPYLDEIKRYKTACKKKRFREPDWSEGSKLNSLKELIRKGENIVSTHALFQKFDKELIEMCRVLGYTLIMDEVANVVDMHYLSHDDQIALLANYCDIETDTNLLVWREEQQDYDGKFTDEKNLCNLRSLAYYNGNVLIWLFPIEVFHAFDNIYILTYMFNSQLQRYYYDYYHVPYTFLHVTGNSLDTYNFSETECENIPTYDYRSLIHICDNEKLNLIGENENNLSVTWFKNNDNTAIMKQLRNNIYNYFNNITGKGSKKNLWTTFKDFKSSLTGKGYSKGYLACNARATNDYKDRDVIAYLANRYINPNIENFFKDHDIWVDKDGFALSEMIQFIWRSAIREGHEIWIYVPSSRMRHLLLTWIIENSPD